MSYYWKLKVGTGRKFNPGQPRVPAGDSRGGQWTSTGGNRSNNISAIPEEAVKNSSLVSNSIGNWTVEDDDEYVSERINEMLDWIKDEYGDYTEDWEEIDYSSVESALLGWAIDSHHRDAFPLHVAAEQEFRSPMSEYTKRKIGRDTSKWDVTNERRALKKIYNDTQSALRRMGISPDDEVVLYRGIQSDPGQYIKRATDNALEAWTVDKKSAEMYRDRVVGAIQQQGHIMAGIFPARRILSLPNYGLGVPSVQEIVVLGGDPVPVFELKQ